MNREDATRSEVLAEALAFAKEVIERKEAGYDVSAHYDMAVELMTALWDAVLASVRRADRPDLAVPEEPLSPIEQAALNTKFDESSRSGDAMLQNLIDGLEIRKRFGLDTTTERAKLKEAFIDGAQLRSALLQLSIDDVAILNAQVKQIPDEKELQSKLR